MGGLGVGPWDYSVSPSPFGLDFGTSDLTIFMALSVLLDWTDIVTL